MTNKWWYGINPNKSDVVVGCIRKIEMTADESVQAYIDVDTQSTRELYKRMVNELYGNKKENNMKIKNVKFNYDITNLAPATIVFWEDGTKTVVKDTYDPEKGLAMAIAKKALGNKGNYYNEFRKWLKTTKTCDSCKYFDNCCTKDHCWDCDDNFCNWTGKDD